MTLKDLLNIEERPKVNVNGTWYEIKGECAKGILAVPSVAPYWENPPIPGIVKMEIDMILADYRSSANGKYFEAKSIFLPSDAVVCVETSEDLEKRTYWKRTTDM